MDPRVELPSTSRSKRRSEGEAARVGSGEPIQFCEGPCSPFEHDRRLLRAGFESREEPLDVLSAHIEPVPKNSSARCGSLASSWQEPVSVTRPASRTQALSA